MIFKTPTRSRHGAPCRLLALLVLLGLPMPGDTAQPEAVSLDYHGLALSGTLRVADDAAPERIVLMVHGTLAHSGMEIMQTFQDLLAETGLNSLAITLSLGVDQRAGMYACDQPHRHRHTDALGEIDAWLRWLNKRGYVHVSLLGHSRGGNQVALYAAQDDPRALDALVLVAPMTFEAESLESGYLRNHDASLSELLASAREQESADGNSLMQVPGFLHCGASQVSPAAFLSYYAPDYKADTPSVLQDITLPILVILGSQDPLSMDLAARLPERRGLEIYEIDGADHFFRDLYADEATEMIAGFLSGLSRAP